MTEILPGTLPEHLAMVRTPYGLMLYPRQDVYIGRCLSLYGAYSPGESQIFAQLLPPGGVAVEAGANIGTHTLALASFVGPEGSVFAIEPQRVVFQMLCANLALNGLTQVHAWQIGLGDAPGRLQVPPVDYTGRNNFGGIALRDAGEGEAVSVHRLDEFALPRLDLLKVDVEGMERAVLHGAQETIRRLRPMLYVENDREAEAPALIGTLREMGYKLFWHMPPLVDPAQVPPGGENVFPGVISANLLCVPAERNITAAGMAEVTDDTITWQQVLAQRSQAG